MDRRLTICWGAAAFIALGGAAPADKDQDSLLALNAIQPGQWAIRPRGTAQPVKVLCLADMRMLLQIRHGAASCTRFVAANGPREAVVHYVCASGGNGRTSVRVETPRLIQIDSQGVADREPFEIALEARRIGACHLAKETALGAR